MPEICGDAAIYFSPESLDGMKNAIEQILTDKDLREKLSNIGFERSKRFSWNISARKTLNIYEEAYKQK
jgi:glycosyltransferase involved in cell wall biosynthesis